MTEKELKKLTRSELLELLLYQTKRTEELEAKLEEAERSLSEKPPIQSSTPGSIAQEAMKINGVFEAAQAAAKQYIDNIKVCSGRCEKMLADTKHHCAELERKAQEKVMMLRAEADRLEASLEGAEPVDSEPMFTEPMFAEPGHPGTDDSDSEES